MWSAGLILYEMSFGRLPWGCALDDYAGLRDEIVGARAIDVPAAHNGRVRYGPWSRGRSPDGNADRHMGVAGRRRCGG